MERTGARRYLHYRYGIYSHCEQPGDLVKRILYLLNMETGEEAEHVDVTDMREPDIVKLEFEMWAKIDEPWAVKDTANAIPQAQKSAGARRPRRAASIDDDVTG